MKLKPLFGIFVSFFVSTSAALAGVAPSPSPSPSPSSSFGETDETTVYVGVNFVFGNQKQTIEGILGVATAETDSSGDVTGGKLGLHFRLNDGFGLRKIKLTGLSGQEDLQGEAGIGWDFENGTFMGILGFNGSYFAGGGDFKLDGDHEGYIGLHTIGSFDYDGDEQSDDGSSDSTDGIPSTGTGGSAGDSTDDPGASPPGTVAF